ncbi:MAG: ankyrin repeat domain-containing protein [Bacteroidetes bacterium]|nr:ankyrin repeat domain-containing protein [Bacteroidota bacterium]
MNKKTCVLAGLIYVVLSIFSTGLYAKEPEGWVKEDSSGGLTSVYEEKLGYLLSLDGEVLSISGQFMPLTNPDAFWGRKFEITARTQILDSKGKKINLTEMKFERLQPAFFWAKGNQCSKLRLFDMAATASLQKLIQNNMPRENIKAVGTLLNKGAYPDIDSNGTTMMLIACLKGYVPLAKMLIKSGADVNKTHSDGYSPLWLAAQTGNIENIRLLLENGADVNFVMSSNGTNVIWKACQNGPLEAVKILLDAGADPSVKVKINDTEYDSIGIAAYAGYASIVETLKARMGNKASGGLIEAAAGGKDSLVRKLLEKGENINQKNPSNGFTALFVASQKGHLKVVELLLNNGADPDLKEDVDGRTALYVASSNGYSEIVKLLLQAGAKTNTENKKGMTAIWAASQEGHAPVVMALLENGVNVNSVESSTNVSALTAASAKGHLDIVELLIKNGANVHLKESTNGITPLFMAVQNGHVKIAELLIRHGSDVNVKMTSNGATALMMACQIGQPEIVRVLLENGADINAEIKIKGETWTALQIAEMAKNKPIIEMLKIAGATH